MLLDGSIRVCVGNAYTLATLGDDWLSCGKTPAACMSIEAGPDQTMNPSAQILDQHTSTRQVWRLTCNNLVLIRVI